MVRTRSHATLAYRIAGCVTCLVPALVLVIGGIIGYLVLREDAEPTGGRTTTATDDVQGGGDQGGGDSAGTPTVLIDGEELGGDPASTGTVRAAVEAG